MNKNIETNVVLGAIVVIVLYILAKLYLAAFGELPSWALESNPEYKVVHVDYNGAKTVVFDDFDAAVAAQNELHESAVGRHTNTVLYAVEPSGEVNKVHFEGRL